MSKKPPDQSAITLEGLLDAAQARGLLINKLGQFEDGWWRASVNDGEQFYEFGEGKTAFEALLARPRKRKAQIDDDAPPSEGSLRSTKPRCDYA